MAKKTERKEEGKREKVESFHARTLLRE